MRWRSIPVLMAAALTAIAIGACGGDDDGDDGGATTAADTESSTVTVKMGDFFFDPKDLTVAAGSVTMSTPNVGQVEHEFVLFKSDADPASLPVSDGKVDGGALEEQGAEEMGEIEDVQPGQTKEKNFDLTAGKYVMFCNLPGHYQEGMYGTVTVE